MIIQDVIKANPAILDNGPVPFFIEASAIMEELNEAPAQTASQKVVTGLSTVPPKTETHLEVAGPQLAQFLGMPPVPGRYPKAAVKALHIQKPLTPQLALDGFHSYLKSTYNTDVQVQPKTAPSTKLFHSLSLLHLYIHYSATEMLTALTQVHYNERGIVYPNDVGVILSYPERVKDPLMHMGNLKDLALVIFGRHHLEQFDTETRPVNVDTTQGPRTLQVQYMLP